MNKTELCVTLAAKTGLTKRDAEKYTEAFFATITEALYQGDKVQLVGFGTFEVKDRPARKARNPRTGEAIDVAASKAPVFKAGKTLKDSLN